MLSAPPPVPVLPDTPRLTTYAISFQTGAFNVGFALYGDGNDFGSWLEVWLNEVELVAGVDYTLSSPSGQIATIPRPITDATITLTVPSTGNLVIVGQRRPRRIAQLAENQGVPARDFNQFITDMVAELRESWDLRSRMFVVPAGEALSTLPPAAQRANKYLAFDASGNVTAIGPPTDAFGDPI